MLIYLLNINIFGALGDLWDLYFSLLCSFKFTSSEMSVPGMAGTPVMKS
jgi:hypothetical protein